MIATILILLANIFLLVIAFLVPFSGYNGAMFLGAIAIILDTLWQCLRLRMLSKIKNKLIGWLIAGGLLVRIISILAIMQIGSIKLRTNAFNVLLIIVLTTPIWNLLYARILKRSVSTN